jgi:aspartyl-tRNA(Asn)/glutamyl-tRNA(Gln) amidotransferase subunit A
MSSTTSQFPTDLWACTATQLNALFASGQASPVQALQSVLARTEALNSKLNAFCYLDQERGLHSARQSEQRWRDQKTLSPLDGVPTSIKDLILTKDWPTLRGSRTVDPKQVWDTDGPCVARLREAGAVIFGKTTTPEYGCKGETNSPLTGITRNPWDLSKTPGGSSGGTAAAIAAGMGPLSIGTDGAGSIRIPAAFCGNFGLKPSFGRVPAFPLSPFGSVAHLGPHTMSVNDAAMLLDVVSQPDARDWTSLEPHHVKYAEAIRETRMTGKLTGLRVAYSPRLGYVNNVHPEVALAVEKAVKQLADCGAIVEQVDPGFTDPLDITVGLWFLGAATIWNGLSPAQRDLTDPDFRDEALSGLKLSALEVQGLAARRGALGSQMRQFMQGFDVLVTPTVSIPAFDARPAGTVPFDAAAFLAWTPFSYPFNLTQQPAATIPCGLTTSGLPIGLQIVGKMFDESTVLRAAAAFETRFPITRPSII